MGGQLTLYPFPLTIIERVCSVGVSDLPSPSPSVCQGPGVPLGITKPDSLDRVILEASETHQVTLRWKGYTFQAVDFKAPNVVRGLNILQLP